MMLIILLQSLQETRLSGSLISFWYVLMNVWMFSFSHLNGAVLETLSRPSLLITDSFTALNVQARRKERDIQLMSELWKLRELFIDLYQRFKLTFSIVFIAFNFPDNIHTAVRRDGNVLLAVDTAGRVLELAQLLVSDTLFNNLQLIPNMNKQSLDMTNFLVSCTTFPNCE